MSQLAARTGLHDHDLFLVAGWEIPDNTLRFDEAAGRALPTLVERALALAPPGLQRLRAYARSLPEMPKSLSPRPWRSFEQYPPSFGSLIVKMLALRNLGWSSGAQVMYLMSGVYLSAATIGAVGRGMKQLDPELLRGFVAVLGVPISVLASLTGISSVPEERVVPVRVRETAALLWDVRHLTADQVRHLSSRFDY